mmetsp:Transcript_49699/g.118425  ORF Transcript_49699/g.118425 Transcript_49699/m.118425 type:complete len:640 (+) Transcript_49699:95-2014(+)
MADLQRTLRDLLDRYPYLQKPEHTLYPAVQEVKQLVAAGSEDAPDKLAHIEADMQVELKTLAAAFKRFCKPGTDSMSKDDVKFMSEYLGFPSTDKDIQDTIKAMDSDRSGTIRFDEFQSYVGFMGGSFKLYEVRRKQISLDGSLEGSPEQVRTALNQAGIDDEAQAFWRLVVPPSEFSEAAKLVSCQQRAIRHIRRLAKANHERALPQLQQKVKSLGYTDNDLWMTLAYIRELAPIIVHIDMDKMLQWIEKDTHYRNQFETKSSGGLLKPDVRKKWERDLFGDCYSGAQGFDCCKYGVLNAMNDYRGVVKCKQYGDSYLVLKDARLRTTYTPEDSANLKAERLAVLDFYAHVLAEFSETELTETLKVANSKEHALLGDSSRVGNMKYKECQIHGEVCFNRHVERIVVADRHRGTDKESRIKAAAAKHGWTLSWMGQERDRMGREEIHRIGPEAWAERLSRLQETQGEVQVAKGCCKVGCGRPVAPGVTRSGKPFTTCCKGCVLGFGHDLSCGKIDASKLGPGLCKLGCGRKVAAGRDAKGRKLDTCCRGCALGMPHDARCGKDVDDTPSGAGSPAGMFCPKTTSSSSLLSRSTTSGLCKQGCGRSVAPGTTRSGKPFDTCCRNCATGEGHSAECDARCG